MGYVYGQDRQGVALQSAWGWDPRRDSVRPGGQLQWNGSPGLPGWMGLLPPQIEGLYFLLSSLSPERGDGFQEINC